MDATFSGQSSQACGSSERSESPHRSRRVIANLWFLLLLGLTAAGCKTTTSSVPSSGSGSGHFHARIRSEQDLRYQVHLPEGYAQNPAESWPLMLFLHGAGERGTNLNAVSVHGPPKLIHAGRKLPIIVIAPQCPNDQVWNTAALLQLLDHVQTSLRVDPKRVYVTGLSMGGYGTWDLISTQPERFAAAAPICGGGNTIPLLLLNERGRKALRTLPIWAFHGAKDAVVPIEETHRMIAAAKRAGATQVRLTTYPEADHDSWSKTYDDPEFWSWIEKQSR